MRIAADGLALYNSLRALDNVRREESYALQDLLRAQRRERAVREDRYKLMNQEHLATVHVQALNQRYIVAMVAVSECEGAYRAFRLRREWWSRAIRAQGRHFRKRGRK